MIAPKFFIDKLKDSGIDFYAGVPDSLLKNICAYISDNIPSAYNIITANEGGAIALAAGYYLATNKIGCVYMQNSGQGNIINPLASLTDKEVYNIPVLLLIGWRGKPGEHDEPQHIKQGKITTGLLNVMGINYDVLSKDETKAQKQIEKAVDIMKTTNEVYALIVEKDTFDTYTLQNTVKTSFAMSREEAIKKVAQEAANDVIISSTGMISRELFEHRESVNQGHEHDFLTVGSMGHASQIALGVALAKPDRKIWCFDGDGAMIMHTGSMAIVGNKAPKNYIHVVFNNGAHDSVGGQPTVGLEIDMPAIAYAMKYKYVASVDTANDLDDILKNIRNIEGPIFIEVKIKKGNRKDLGRPTTTPIQNKISLMQYLKD
ncbi:MAG: phosphonopyruvate decarboxylase [Bacteroidales bacterium]|nr:phosphonopyruvate decarboxylase [Bacteroidales bacterium]